jgi:hypothetical protein
VKGGKWAHAQASSGAGAAGRGTTSWVPGATRW